MSIWHVNIDLGGKTYCAHLKDEDDLFFQVPIESDGSENWARLQSWLDNGNKIVDDMSNKDVWYIDQRKSEYPSWEDQMDKIFHEGLDAWKADIKAVKDKYPKGNE
tara:strand:+ start:3854 stop:4171 length:318 start_codon:yes stop_codon:yes gene_type:complete